MAYAGTWRQMRRFIWAQGQANTSKAEQDMALQNIVSKKEISLECFIKENKTNYIREFKMKLREKKSWWLEHINSSMNRDDQIAE
jgi:hypothetical protein